MVEVEGGQLWVERTGEGEPVVLIHDGIVHAVEWDDVLPVPCPASSRSSATTAAATGARPQPQATFSHLTDLEAVLRHLAVGKVHLVGSSSGGGLAIDFALAHPEQVASLTLVGAVVSGFPYTRHFLDRGGRLTQAIFADPAQVRRVLDAPSTRTSSRPIRRPHASASPRSWKPRPRTWARAGSSSRLPRPPALPHLATITVPTLVLVGEHDIPDVHAHAGAIAAGIPHARREVLRDCGHVPYLEQPDELRDQRPAVPAERPVPRRARQPGSRPRPRRCFARPAPPTARRFSPPRTSSTAGGTRSSASGALPDAIAVFRLNTEAFPASANTHDSLGEALLAAGDREGATAAYRKALEIDPASASAKEALQTLGAPLAPRP